MNSLLIGEGQAESNEDAEASKSRRRYAGGGTGAKCPLHWAEGITIFPVFTLFVAPLARVQSVFKTRPATDTCKGDDIPSSSITRNAFQDNTRSTGLRATSGKPYSILPIHAPRRNITSNNLRSLRLSPTSTITISVCSRSKFPVPLLQPPKNIRAHR